MIVLVTGSEGFVGQFLVPYLIEKGIHVITLDKEPADEISDLDKNQHIQYLLGSFKEGFRLPLVDAVIHLASDSDFIHPKTMINYNIMGTLELYELCSHTPMNQIVQFSTHEVGSCLSEFPEEYKYNTESIYSASKAAQELLAQAYTKTFDLPIITTRCVNIFGPSKNEDNFVSTVCKKAMKNESIPIYGSGMQVMQWVSLDHVCDFLNSLLLATFIPPRTLLHITGSKEIPNIMLTRSILNILDKPPSLISYVQGDKGSDASSSLRRTEETDRFGLPYYDENNFMQHLEQTVNFYKEKYNV